MTRCCHSSLQAAYSACRIDCCHKNSSSIKATVHRHLRKSRHYWVSVELDGTFSGWTEQLTALSICLVCGYSLERLKTVKRKEEDLKKKKISRHFQALMCSVTSSSFDASGTMQRDLFGPLWDLLWEKHPWCCLSLLSMEIKPTFNLENVPPTR